MLFCYGITVIVNVYINAFFDVNRGKRFKACFAVNINSYANICNCMAVGNFVIVKGGYVKVYGSVIIKGSYINVYNAGGKRKRGT